MPAQDKDVKPSTSPVHLGQTFGVTPNPNAKGPATVAAIGNPYGGMKGPGRRASRNRRLDRHRQWNQGSAPTPEWWARWPRWGIPRRRRTAPPASMATARWPRPAFPAQAVAAPVQRRSATGPTNLEVLSKPPVQYTSEAKQLKVQGDVILRVTFTAGGQVVVQSVVHGLGHGLDEEARRVAQQIRFRPATRNGQAVDMTTNITITFQLA
jgi:TonB family protein